MNENDAINLLKKYGKNKKFLDIILRHVKKVQEISLRHAEEIPSADIEFIRIASLLHDIGRFDCPPDQTIKHGIIGAEILRKEGIDEKYALLCERHLGAGISKEEIKEQNLDLPIKDYIPLSTEEKIITDADNLVFGDREGSFEEVEKRFLDEMGEKTAKKVVDLHNEVKNMME